MTNEISRSDRWGTPPVGTVASDRRPAEKGWGTPMGRAMAELDDQIRAGEVDGAAAIMRECFKVMALANEEEIEQVTRVISRACASES